jgi:hypothetical protein
VITATKQQRVVIDALQTVSGFEDWRFTAAAKRLVIVQSCHDLDYVMRPDGSLAALPYEKCGKCEGTGQVNKRRGLGVSMKLCECQQRRRGIPDVTLKERIGRFLGRE